MENEMMDVVIGTNWTMANQVTIKDVMFIKRTSVGYLSK